jgi:hypothetical protein
MVTYASETWAWKESTKQKFLNETKALRRIFGPTKERDGGWRIKTSVELNNLIKNKSRVLNTEHLLRMAFCWAEMHREEKHKIVHVSWEMLYYLFTGYCFWVKMKILFLCMHTFKEFEVNKKFFVNHFSNFS